MSVINYYRVSTKDQTVESQRAALGPADHEFSDEGVSGGVMAAHRPGFAELLKFVRKGDTVRVYALDRLGRDAIDVQQTVKGLMAQGVTVDIRGIGPVAPGAGEIIIAVLAQVAELERRRINERAADGRKAAREALAKTGKTQNGKASLGRSKSFTPIEVANWRKANGASISGTAKQFGISAATVARYCAEVRDAA